MEREGEGEIEGEKEREGAGEKERVRDKLGLIQTRTAHTHILSDSSFASAESVIL